MTRNGHLRIFLYGWFYLLPVSLPVLIAAGPLSQRTPFCELTFNGYLIFHRTDFLNPLQPTAGHFRLSLLPTTLLGTCVCTVARSRRGRGLLGRHLGSRSFLELFRIPPPLVLLWKKDTLMIAKQVTAPHPTKQTMTRAWGCGCVTAEPVGLGMGGDNTWHGAAHR